MIVNGKRMVLLGQAAWEAVENEAWQREADEDERQEFWQVFASTYGHLPHVQERSISDLLVDAWCRPYRLVVIDGSAPVAVLHAAAQYIRVHDLATCGCRT